MRQAGNVLNTTETDQAQTLRLFVERTKRECEEKPDQMQDHRQASQEYGMEKWKRKCHWRFQEKCQVR